eukprot:7391833-Prymnesium_polylepis.2
MSGSHEWPRDNRDERTEARSGQLSCDNAKAGRLPRPAGDVDVAPIHRVVSVAALLAALL